MHGAAFNVAIRLVTKHRLACRFFGLGALLPGTWGSDYSFARFTVPNDPACIAAFRPDQNSFLGARAVICTHLTAAVLTRQGVAHTVELDDRVRNL